MAQCEICGIEGIESNWPGNDPANWGTEETILCADENGHLVCDDCYSSSSEDE